MLSWVSGNICNKLSAPCRLMLLSCQACCAASRPLPLSVWMNPVAGTWLTERENWTEAGLQISRSLGAMEDYGALEAKTKLARSKKLFEHFLLAADQAHPG